MHERIACMHHRYASMHLRMHAGSARKHARMDVRMHSRMHYPGTTKPMAGSPSSQRMSPTVCKKKKVRNSKLMETLLNFPVPAKQACAGAKSDVGSKSEILMARRHHAFLPAPLSLGDTSLQCSVDREAVYTNCRLPCSVPAASCNESLRGRLDP